ncbi:hypothetical protein [Megalodesulfovibrio paquesii]
MAGLYVDDDPLEAHGPVPITELARRFLLPESTARYYCKRFLPWLPHTGQGKRRRFLPEALPVFQAIVQGMQEHKDARAVEQQLGDPLVQSQGSQPNRNITAIAPVQPHAADVAVIQPTALHPHELGELALAVRQQGAALQTIAGTLLAMQSQQQEIAILREELTRRDAETAALREELRRLTLLQDSAEKTHQQDLEQLRKWLAAMARQQQKSEGKQEE